MRRLVHRSSRVAPESSAKYICAVPPPGQADESHLLRHLLPRQTKLMHSIMDACLVRVSPPQSSTSYASSSSESGSEQSSIAEFRVPTEKDKDADLIRARIYAINRLLAARQKREWEEYKQRKHTQMVALGKCAESCWPSIARWGLRRMAERCERVRRDEIRRAEMLKRLAEERRRRESEALARVAAQAMEHAKTRQVLHSNHDLLETMPVDPDAKPTASMPRYCPWYSTVDGCKLSRCPLSHAKLPDGLVTWKYRLWALESHNGWTGEPVNAGLCTGRPTDSASSGCASKS